MLKVASISCKLVPASINCKLVAAADGAYRTPGDPSLGQACSAGFSSKTCPKRMVTQRCSLWLLRRARQLPKIQTTGRWSGWGTGSSSDASPFILMLADIGYDSSTSYDTIFDSKPAARVGIFNP